MVRRNALTLSTAERAQLAARNDAVVRLFSAEGITVSNLAIRFAISRSTVRGILKAARDRAAAASLPAGQGSGANDQRPIGAPNDGEQEA